MKQLTINRARTLGKDMNAKGIVILAFGDDVDLGDVHNELKARP